MLALLFYHACRGPRSRRRNFRALLACSLALAGAPAPTLAVDSLLLIDGSRREGTFERFRSGQFEFSAGDDKPQKTALNRVASLTLTPPVAADVRRRAGRRLDGLTFVQYAKPEFHFLQDGQPLKIPSAQVAAIDPVASLQREMQHVADRESPDASAARDATFELPITTGRVTVVHFHRDDVMSSVRQGNYLRTRCTQFGDKVVFVRISIQDRDDPVARRYQITSIPQFWFYDRTGQMQCRLSERFTEEDLDAALDAARR